MRAANGMETQNKFHWNSFLAYVVLVLIRNDLFGQYELTSEVYAKATIVASPPNDKLIYSYFLLSVR
jgi:hypothetical protein